MASARAHAEALLSARDRGNHIAPISQRPGGLDMREAYEISAEIDRLRAARGEVPVGRKIGFTNRTIWPLYGVDGPMWGTVWDTTLHQLPGTTATTDLPPLTEPRVEPEIAFGFRAAPRSGMSEAEVAGTIDWIAHSFEIVFSPYPGWRFTGADTAAAFGLHGALFLGPRRPLTPDILAALPTFRITLTDGARTLHGKGADVIDGPLAALGFLLDGLAATPGARPIGPGEVVTTGTLTDAAPVAPGDTWSTTLEDLDLPGLSVTFR